MKKRKIIDGMLNGITMLFSSISIIILASLVFYIFQKGIGSINMDLFLNPYWSNNYLVAPIVSNQTNFQKPSTLGEDVFFSSKYGIGLVDAVDESKQKVVLIAYVDPNSSFASMQDLSNQDKNTLLTIQEGYTIEKLDYEKNGISDFCGMIMKDDAQKIISIMDNEAEKMVSLYTKSPKGGIRGSLITTFYLIVVSLLVALPIGVCAAIYLNEYAKKNRLNKWIGQGIEMLAGVPSIIYGLMGVTVLFPITQALGATSANILLGALTLGIILLPNIIKTTTEALLVVPKAYRDGSYSLGASKAQTVFFVVLPNAVMGILTGVLLSIGRIIGESAALIYTMGTFINDSPTLLSQGTSLAVHIYTIMGSEQPNFELASAIALIILFFVLILNLGVKLFIKTVQNRKRRSFS